MALDLIIIAGLTWLVARTERIKANMATRQDLDNVIAALPGVIEKATAEAVTTAVAPIIAKLGTPVASGEDFSAEIAALSGLGGTVSASVSSAVAAALAPPPTESTLPPTDPTLVPPVDPAPATPSF